MMPDTLTPPLSPRARNLNDRVVRRYLESLNTGIDGSIKYADIVDGSGGILVLTGVNTVTGREILGTSGRITLANGTGIGGDPVINIDPAYVGQTSITTLGTITTGDVSRADYLVNATGAVARDVRDRFKDVLNVKDFGALGDGVADDSAAINAAIAAAPSTGARIIIPAGTYKVLSSINLNKTCILEGSGRDNTTIQCATVGVDGIISSANKATVRSLSILSSIVGRTAAGLKITGGVESSFYDLTIQSQGNGIHLIYAGIDIYNVHCSGNNINGIFCDGSAGGVGVNGTRLRWTQTHGNGECGIKFLGLGIGLDLQACGSAQNGLDGICFASSGGNACNDIWIVEASLSTNGRYGFNFKDNANFVNGIITSSFCETSTNSNLILSTTSTGFTIVGNTFTGSSNAGLEIYGTNHMITGNHIASNLVAGIIYNATYTSFANNICSSVYGGTQPLGFRFDGGTSCSIAGGDYTGNTAVYSGTIPTGSLISAALGFSNVLTSTLKDVNGNNVIGISPTASAVNYIQITNATAGAPQVKLAAEGTSTDIDLYLLAKGAGATVIRGRAGAACVFGDVATPTHEVVHSLSSVTASRTITWQDATGTLALLGNKLSDFAATSSAELKTVISDETGSGALVFANSPTLVTPVLGVATATSINGLTVSTSTGTLTIANSKTLTNSNTLTLTATDGSTLNIGNGGTLGSAAYTASSAYEVPLTFSTGLTRTTNTITVNTSQNISTLSNLTTNGLVTTSGGTGALSITAPGTGVLTFLATPSTTNLLAALTTKVQFKVYLSSNQSINTASWTKIQFNSEVYDTNNNFDSSTNYRFIPGVAGKYHVYVKGTFLSSIVANSSIAIAIYKNGSNINDVNYVSNATNTNSMQASIDIDMNGSTDYLEAFVIQITGISANLIGGANGIDTFFCGHLIL